MLKPETAPGEGSKKRTGEAAQSDGPGPAAPEPQRRFLSRQFASSPRGARLARRIAVRHLGEWGFPPMSDASCTVALLVAELAANAVRHGRAPGRDFHLLVAFDGRASRFRIEVSDASADRLPVRAAAPAAEEESGRGLLLVDVLADRWGWEPRVPVGKTVWADVVATP
ncbi:ATP-binding protein [Streptomyces sp. SID10853]|uniref:ATP-binding protein n=1 Tax=Streptomyces sp. SID10853 TaxID=2706028 RepID=UPI0013C1C423|nr:ATP-binding protein [Streptomyces sp. SID10853]NDZ80963.1 ATP-binding protein [Streptomyces sp. SID10853]